jgi:hypothetical protein
MITVTAEKLKGDQQIILRFYADGVEPVNPNKFEHSLTLDCFGHIAEAKGAVEFPDAFQKISLGSEKLKSYGIKLINYQHNGRWKVIEVA